MSGDLPALTRAAAVSGRRLLAPYLCAGWPTADATPPLLEALVAAGADLIELGVPFSDPLADGASLQRAARTALAGGMTLSRALAIAARFTAGSGVPLVLMTYVNPLLRAGGAAALRRAAAAGCAAAIVPDLPFEEAALLAEAGKRPALPLVPLAAPNTSDTRLRELVGGDPPFLYCVALLGVTGARAGLDRSAPDLLRRARAAAPGLPLLAGFGVSAPGQAARLAAAADGVIVGSALADHLSAQPPGADLPAAAAAFLRPLRAALDALGARPTPAPGGAPC
ncbi:MAG: tryptophan synthase subunit alpha [Candidatus Krumholzibacteriia bacterium]